MKCFKCVAPLDIPNTVVGPNRFNYANQTSRFVGVVMVKKMNPLLHSIFLHNVSSCEKVFSGYFITWRCNYTMATMSNWVESQRLGSDV